MTTRWLDPPPLEIPASFSDLSLHPLIARTLLSRGYRDPASARAFLHPEEIPSTPFPGIEAVIERITSAIQKQEPICVWGDFDVDGQTATALLVQTLRALGANVVYYIPIRGKESHGVHIPSLQSILDNGIRLIVTCDTGITAYEAIDYANGRGVDVIVTDHHDLGERLPNARAIINPKTLPEDHPLANLAGVGVAYKVAEALLQNFESQIQNAELLDLVALGLIADVALLKGETRALVKRGIQQLRQTKRPGLRAMATLAGASLETLTEETIGFTFAPRLNALGRLSDANLAVELLLTHEPSRAQVLATQIEGLNLQRRLLTRQVYEAAEAQLRDAPHLLTEPVIVLTHPDWPGGVVGIVANKLVERYHKPTILLSESEDGILRGSARSIEGLHITEAIATQKDILLSFGGHPMAAGLSLRKENLAAFRRGLGKAVEAQLGSTAWEEPSLQIDAWVGLEEINLELADALERLAPFGAGNPELVLAIRGVSLKSATEIGKTKEHLRLHIEDEQGNSQSLLWWNGVGEELPEAGSKVDVAFSLRASSYRGQRQVTLQLVELRLVAEKAVEIRPWVPQVVDWRLEQARWQDLSAEVMIWVEGAERSKGKARFELQPADELAIYTIPPSPTELRQALEVVQPKKIYLLGAGPGEEKPEEFLSRLAGLCKFAIRRRGGQATLSELAAATAQRESTVLLGLDWLVAGGHLSFELDDENGILRLKAGDGLDNPYLRRELFVAVRGALHETAAYRSYFVRAEASALVGF
ncbi:MAG: single-stranded-DNA-specific exonuclease RecJ [Anaerolineae bacterium]